MRQALHALEAGTPAVKAVLLNEVNLVYECRVCFNMFRSLANLVSHKARFCRQRYADVRHEFADKKKGGDGDEENATAAPEFTTVIIEPEPVKDCCSSTTDPSSWDLATYSPSMELIKTAGILEDLGMVAAAAAVTERPLIDRLHPGSGRKKGLSSILSQLSGRRPMLPSHHQSAASGLTVRLEPVYSTTNALYQSWRLTDEQGTVYPSVKDLNMTLQRIVIGDDHTVVGPDGLAVVVEDSNPSPQQPAAQQKSGGGDKTTPVLQSNGKMAADNEELREKRRRLFGTKLKVLGLKLTNGTSDI